jgi:hypothetical protein
MAAPSPRLDALKALLTSARELARMLEADPTLPRVLRALASIPPDDRETIASALERAAASRRVNEAFARMNGIRMHVNPNPRLYVRVVDAEPSASVDALEEEDVVPDIFLLMRRVPMLLAPAGRAVWQPALRTAAALLTPAQRETCLRFVDDVRAFLVADGAAPPDPDEPAA